MRNNFRKSQSPSLSSRQMLARVGAGFGSLALADLLSRQSVFSAERAASPLAARPGHFPARAKRVIFLFMHGGPSHVDTFDYKPELIARDGQPLPFAKPRVQFAQTGNLMKSPWKFEEHGQCGSEVSEVPGAGGEAGPPIPRCGVRGRPHGAAGAFHCGRTGR